MDILNQFAYTIDIKESGVIDHVREYMEWQAGGENAFIPGVDDDVHLRTYLLELNHQGLSPVSQRQRLNSILKFYRWAKEAGLIENTPDYYFSIERPSLTPEQIRRRDEIFDGSEEQREIARLNVLNKLAVELNHANDIQKTLDISLEAIVSTLGLETAWFFLLPEAGSKFYSETNLPPHDFALAAKLGLPPGLERDDCMYLTQPGDCHCQAIMRAGQMRRAVNIVECTRLEESAEAEGDNQGLLFHASVPIIAGDQTLGMINVATEEWQFLTASDLQLLSTIGAQVAVALQRSRLFEESNRQRERLERELQLAHIVQTSLLPQTLPEIPGYSLAADWCAAREMAGDFYDVFKLPGDRWGIIVADVSDKGAPAAMYMAMTRSLIRAQIEINPNPADTLKEVNRHLNAYSNSGMFVSLFYTVLDVKRSMLIYSSAGHNPPLLRRTSGDVEEILPTGPVLGVLDEIEILYESISLHPGDTLFIYTDGVTDALNRQGEEFGLERLQGMIKNLPVSSAKTQMNILKEERTAFIGDAPSFDDITCFVLTRE
ncbi:MAG: GAF domain-containing SpoIIE family protein phosphatase [Anaerolineales bacterium]|jgi:serine phosphatase RsbU (regulator of sigma subunit)